MFNSLTIDHLRVGTFDIIYVGGNDTYGINGIPTVVGGRGVVRRAGPKASTKVVYPGSGCGDRVIP